MVDFDRHQVAWSVPVAVHELPDLGRRYEIVADEHARAAVCRLAVLQALPRLEAAFEVVRQGRSAVRVTGHVSATVEQSCVVTLEPILNEVEEPVDVVYASEPAGSGHAAVDIELAGEDPPESLVGGTLDLGKIATEFLMLGIDPYPRKPGAVFEPLGKDEGDNHPFAALAALKKLGQEPGK